MKGKGGGSKRKNHVLQSVFFSWFAHTCLYVTHVKGNGGGNKPKNHVLQSVASSLGAKTASYEGIIAKARGLFRGYNIVTKRPYQVGMSA